MGEVSVSPPDNTVRLKPIKANLSVPYDRRCNITGTINVDWYHLNIGDMIRIEIDGNRFEVKVINYDSNNNEYFVSGKNQIEVMDNSGMVLNAY